MNLKTLTLPLAFVASLAVSSVGLAQAPAGSTGECKDGTYTSVETKRGACAGHKGVKEWYGAQAKSEAKSAKSDAKSAKAEAKAEAKAAKAEAKAAKTEAKAAKTEAKSTGAMTAPSSSSAAAAPAAPAAMPRSSGNMSAATTKAQQGMRAEAAPGGGAGKVWVNASTKVYHCMGDEWYGKTKAGEYMSEADAKSHGAHAARGKACS
jgi:hypothetical protein